MNRSSLPGAQSLLRAALGSLAFLLLAAPAGAASGGPDAGGYEWHDSADGCATLNDAFVLANATGFFDGGLQDNIGPFDLGFAFPFHDLITTQVWVNRSGLVFFEAPPEQLFDMPQAIPMVDSAVAFVAPYWDSWDEASQQTDSIYWEQLGDAFKLSWSAQLLSNGSEVRWQLYLYPDGRLRVEYLDIGLGPFPCTIGLESPDQTTGLQVYQDGVVEDPSFVYGSPEPFAICYEPAIDCGPTTLACNSTVSGDTGLASNTADLYSCSGLTYDGPEEVYTFVNPVSQIVSFVLDAADDRLDVLLLDNCDEASCTAVADASLERELPAGTYRVVVDGREGAAGPYELTVICGNELEPSVLRINGAEGECFDEHKTAWLTPTIPKADVLFAIDLTASMGQERSQLQANMQSIVDELQLIISDVAFGLVHYKDYDASGLASSPCAYDATSFGAPDDYPYQLEQSITSSRVDIQAAVDRLPLVGGGNDFPESYSRVLWEAVHDGGIGWRPGSRRIFVNFGDDLPHDCNVLDCLGDTSPQRRGIDLGRDGSPGGGDDLGILDVIQDLIDAQTALIHLDSGADTAGVRSMDGPFTYTQIWDCWAQRTGGVAQELNRDGTVPGGLDLAVLIGDVIEQQGGRCSTVELVAEPGFEDWLVSASPVYSDVDLPAQLEFDIRVCVPLGTAPGVYTFQVQLLCSGGLVAVQEVSVTVGVDCEPAIVAGPSDETICLGDTATLDAGGIGLVNCAGTVDTEWFDGSGNPTGTGSVIDVSPSATTTYTVEVSCSTDPACGTTDDATVTVHAPPTLASAEARDINTCILGIELSWPEAVFPSGDGVYNVYRSEISCDDALTRPPVQEGLTGLGWNDRDTVSLGLYFYVVEAEDSMAGTLCSPTGPVLGGAVARVCVDPPVQDFGTADFPDGVYAQLFARHDGQQVTFYWDAARALLPGETFRLLKTVGEPTETWGPVNGAMDLSREYTEIDTAAGNQFFDLRVANACGDLSVDEFPPSR